jgi:hypothetical protein
MSTAGAIAALVVAACLKSETTWAPLRPKKEPQL